ncbi:MAG: HNH endonuclease [Planctomycetaceae bacterium]|nr:HNH endonuclease [Planctomycetaceae bacterium]MBV8269263.1 HNH endonuclease [Planctomycetaceae bacterium]MBV8316881.1 HNH endonuclease [Planctomycetaceae bacterium]
MQVIVLDTNRKPLDPCSPARARILLAKGRAAVFRTYPFTIILKDRKVEDSVVHEHRVKIDPGSKTTGIAVVRETTGQVVAAVEVEHRGQTIKAALADRAVLRGRRRARKTRSRKPRFDNRTRPEGWLAPSLESRLANVMTWVARLRRSVPVAALSQELVRFDLQKGQDPEISGLEYQQGTLAGYETREYLLEKFRRTCAYCGKKDVPLQVEHIHPKSRGGSDRVSNLALACEPCNRRKGDKPVDVFLKGKPEVLAEILKQAKAPLKDAAAVNATRWELFRRLQATGLPVECGSGGRTKFHRTTRGLPKTHWLDAACVGASTPEHLGIEGVRPLLVKACGHGKRNRCGTDKHGFPIRHAPRAKTFRGFRTGDIVRADIPNGKHRGTHVGRIAIRFRPSFRLGAIDVHPDRLTVVQRADGYGYSFGETVVLSSAGSGDSPVA